ncbi:succinate dehydrogenase assembly factor 4, mitochondrial-like [Ditylenchus destructor]|uniref:Succinate dehydrogenase assembly factor 4, mitochondrial n=1 Tax=Ditylenchus destructor TaxID=166010 RepID=A0AAD4N648_9BILA|nr:succinate dehydrogenase assembly factor 4, mitochondrial-like [Ditylenchus destructor]
MNSVFSIVVRRTMASVKPPNPQQSGKILSTNNGNTENEAQTDGQGEKVDARLKEIGGPRGLEPTRYGDWESHGRARDF